jgi:DNA-binding GntR family transcriptional regulator
MTTPGRPKTSTAAAVDQLRDMILTGELSAHSDHLEAELADRLGMSRTPVREATLVLQGMGLLEVRPRKGVRIKPVTVRDMEEVYEVLTELESLAAFRAAKAGYSPDDLAGLKAATERMEAALAHEDRTAWAEADEDFHTELVRLGGNSRVAEIVRLYNDQVRRARAATLHARPLPTASNKDHRALYEAILAGDAEGAHDIHRSHRIAARELLTGILTQLGLRYV